jgi:hypothetical protein
MLSPKRFYPIIPATCRTKSQPNPLPNTYLQILVINPAMTKLNAVRIMLIVAQPL